MTLANAIRGQRVVIPLNAVGGLSRELFQLLRAEDDRVDAWTVVLAPVTQNAVGEMLEGQPARSAGFFPGAAGNPRVQMTWGGGGVTFRTQFQYPVNGATFAVAGQNISLQVGAFTALGGFTDATRPALEGWCAPNAYPTAREPLVEWILVTSLVPEPVLPWTRAVWVSKDVNTVCTVTFSPSLVTIIIPVQVGVQRIALPTGTETVTVTSVIGAPAVGFEMAFT